MMEFTPRKVKETDINSIVINGIVVGSTWHNGNQYQCQITGLGLQFTEASTMTLNACGDSPIEAINKAVKDGYDDLEILRNALEILTKEIPKDSK